MRDTKNSGLREVLLGSQVHIIHFKWRSNIILQPKNLVSSKDSI